MNPTKLLRAWLNTASENRHLRAENAYLKESLIRLDKASQRATDDLIRVVEERDRAETHLSEVLGVPRVRCADTVPDEWAEGHR